MEPHPSTARLEAFTDGVFAILITIMVLDLHAPTGLNLLDLKPIIPTLFSYILSFIYLIIYWNNHHHLLKTVHKPNAPIMWANAYLLFWLSLVPFVTSWLGQSGGAVIPAVLYGVVHLGAASAYFTLQQAIIRSDTKHSILAKAIGSDIKGNLSLALYTLAILGAFITPIISYVLYIAVALMWIIPDKRIERVLGE